MTNDAAAGWRTGTTPAATQDGRTLDLDLNAVLDLDLDLVLDLDLSVDIDLGLDVDPDVVVGVDDDRVRLSKRPAPASSSSCAGGGWLDK